MEVSFFSLRYPAQTTQTEHLSNRKRFFTFSGWGTLSGWQAVTLPLPHHRFEHLSFVCSSEDDFVWEINKLTPSFGSASSERYRIVGKRILGRICLS